MQAVKETELGDCVGRNLGEKGMQGYKSVRGELVGPQRVQVIPVLPVY